MPRTKEQFAEMRQASQRKIRTAAIRLFAQKGFAATSIDDIVEAAGLSKGMFYRHYETKEALFSSLLEAAAAGTLELIGDMKSDNDPREIVESITADIYEHMTDDSEFADLMMVMTQRLMSKDIPGNDELIGIDVQAVAAGIGLIRRGQEMGVFGVGDPQEMAVYFFSAIQGVVMMKFAVGEHFQMPNPSLMTAFLYRGLQE